MALFDMVWHWPWCVKRGDRVWNISTVPVGRSLDKCAVPLNAFLMVLCAGVLGLFCGSTFSKSGSRVLTSTSISLLFLQSSSKGLSVYD